MKADHLSDLKQKKGKYTLLAAIKNANIEEIIININIIKNDIEENML